MGQYFGFGVFAPTTMNPYVIDAFRDLAREKGGATKYHAILDIKQGKPVDDAVEFYMSLRDRGTGDAEALKQEFTRLAELDESEVKKRYHEYESRARATRDYLFGR